jgi:hypothetical protein
LKDSEDPSGIEDFSIIIIMFAAGVIGLIGFILVSIIP